MRDPASAGLGQQSTARVEPAGGPQVGCPRRFRARKCQCRSRVAGVDTRLAPGTRWRRVIGAAGYLRLMAASSRPASSGEIIGPVGGFAFM